MREGCREMQDTSGVHVWLVLGKAFRALAAHAEESLNRSRTCLGDSEFRVLEVLLHQGPLPVNTIGPKEWLTLGSISVAVDRLAKKALVKRKNTDESPRATGRTHFERPRAHRQDLSEARGRDGRGRPRPLRRGAADVLRLLKKLGQGGEVES
jgi:hypothetical protein